MKILLIMALFIPTLSSGQSTIPTAVKETLNLSPRCKKGDMQRYELQVENFVLGEDASPTSFRKDLLSFTQYCTSNTPEAGLEYRIAVDSFMVGAYRSVDQPEVPLMIVKQLDGFQYLSRITRSLPEKNGCYDHGLSFPDSLRYIEIYDLVEDYRYLRLIEQFRFTAGLRLSKIGDTVRISLPGPICEKINGVINLSKIELAPQLLELTGLTKYGSTPCAIVTLRPSTSKASLDIYNRAGLPLVGNGTMALAAMFTVSLDDGDILSATITERSDSNMKGLDGNLRLNRRHRTLRLRQLN